MLNLTDPLRVVILLSGPRCSGKDTVADHLVEEHGFIKLAFADELKKHVSDLFDFPLQWCYTREGKSRVVPMGHLTVGELLQIYGTNVAREINPDLWAAKIKRKIEYLGLQYVVIPDCRFANEYEMFAKDARNVEYPRPFSACFVLQRCNSERIAHQMGDKRDPSHPSENGWRDILKLDEPHIYTLHNNSSLRDLRESVDTLMRKIANEVG